MYIITPLERNRIARDLGKFENLTTSVIRDGYLSGAEQDGHHDEGYQLSKRTSAIESKRASELAKILRNSKVVTPHEQNTKVALGTGVSIKYGDHECFFVICGYAGIYSDKQVVSIASPLGSSLVGKEVGDEFDVELPNGEVHIEIMKIVPPSEALAKINHDE